MCRCLATRWHAQLSWWTATVPAAAAAWGQPALAQGCSKFFFPCSGLFVCVQPHYSLFLQQKRCPLQRKLCSVEEWETYWSETIVCCLSQLLFFFFFLIKRNYFKYLLSSCRAFISVSRRVLLCVSWHCSAWVSQLASSSLCTCLCRLHKLFRSQTWSSYCV